MPDLAGVVEIQLGVAEIGQFISDNFDSKSVDHLGYDLRMGNCIIFVTRGESREYLGMDETVDIFPGETILVKTEEVLHLPGDVFGLGSPKMSLIAKGLWAHGGKTDFGYNQTLTLSFHHVGAKIFKLKRGDPIFHLSFFKVVNKDTVPYSGFGPGFPTGQVSPLDDEPNLGPDLEERVKSVDGIKSSRLVRLLGRNLGTTIDKLGNVETQVNTLRADLNKMKMRTNVNMYANIVLVFVAFFLALSHFNLLTTASSLIASIVGTAITALVYEGVTRVLATRLTKKQEEQK